MELEQIKEQWQVRHTPSYSKDELDSIFHIRHTNVALSFRSLLKADLIIAELLALGFIITLQILDLRMSNFWSLIMTFVGVQHFIIYLLQDGLIRRIARFNGNVLQSIELSIKNLGILQWCYRVIPVLLGSILYLVYVSGFNPSFTSLELMLIWAAIALFILIVSEILSSVLIKTQINRLKSVKSSLLDISEE